MGHELLFGLLITVFFFGYYFKDIKIVFQAIWEELIVEVSNTVNMYGTWDKEWDELLEGVSNTESTADYQVGCNTDEKSDWEDEIRDYLNCYCPKVFTEFLIRRIGEIKDE